MKRKMPGDIAADVIIVFLLALAAALSILPLIHILAVSLSAAGPADANLVRFIPMGFNVEGYKEVFRDNRMSLAILQSVKRALLGITVNMALTILCAYPLSHDKKHFSFRSVYSGLVVFTMLFSGGLIPSYILINRLNLMDTFWALVLPGVPVFHVVIMMNFFRQIPAEMREAASIDGAGHFTILFRIFLPMSGAVIATLVLFCFVGHWNAWFDSMIYLRDINKQPLQNYIQAWVAKNAAPPTSLEEARRLAYISRRSVLFARIFISIVPIMIIYPLLQKYFKSGIVIGAVKG